MVLIVAHKIVNSIKFNSTLDLHSPGTIVRKLPAYMTEILLGKGVK
jgi:hypothetical protein